MWEKRTTQHIFVDILCICFGVGTWLCVNGLWVELPLLVQHLPEGWALPSFIAVIIQLANVGPITYTFLHSFFPSVVTEKRSVYFVMTLALGALLLLSQFWDFVVVVWGVRRSVVFFGLVLILAAVDCSSRVIYLPFMAKFKPEYLTCFFIGEGLSGFIPSIFAVIQGIGGNPDCVNVTVNGTVVLVPSEPHPLFSIESFFYILVAITLVSAVSFRLLNEDAVVVKCLAKNVQEQKNDSLLLDNQRVQFYEATDQSSLRRVEKEEDTPIDLDTVVNTDSYPVPVTLPPEEIPNSIPQSEYILLMILLTIVCSLANGVFPSIQSFSCLPYGNSAYHWAVTLSSMANPAVCFLMLFTKRPWISTLVFMSLAAFAFGGYIFYTAVDAGGWIVGTFGGEVVLVTSWICLVALFTYVKVSIATTMRAVKGKRGLFWTGVFTQFGSSFGAVLAFSVVNFTGVFRSFNPCGNN